MADALIAIFALGLLPGGVAAWLLIGVWNDINSGTSKTGPGIARHSEHPFRYWCNVIAKLGSGLAMLSIPVSILVISIRHMLFE